MRAYERLLNYVTIHTTSSEETGTHPSFKGEFELGNKLKREMEEIGLTDIVLDEKCYLYGFLPATKGYENATPIGFIAHMDTAPDASGEGVEPILHKEYDGSVVKYPKSKACMDPEKFPFLKSMVGETLITSSGDTLLGADDKAGLAEIMTAMSEIVEKNIPHGPLYVGFTPDEEIGEGADYFDLKVFKAKYAYTVDGGDANCLEYENFNAAGAKVVINGFSVHPGDAYKVMVNASNVAMEFHALLPKEQRPEETRGREGFFHLTDMKGETQKAELSYIIRDHDKTLFEEKKKKIQEVADTINQKYGDGTVELTVKDSYYNMLEKIKPHMHLVETARLAIQSEGMQVEEIAIRGGTDGARLSFEGLPCPNLGTGGFNFHGPFECITAERMDRVVNVILNLVEKYRDFK